MLTDPEESDTPRIPPILIKGESTLALIESSDPRESEDIKEREEVSSFIYNLPSKIDQYIDLGELKELGDLLEKSPYQVALYGEEGSGKTVLALEYCFKKSGKYSFIIWCPADDPEVLYYSYYKFCIATNLLKMESKTELKEESKRLDKREVVTRESIKNKIKDYLAAKVTGDMRCLFVYDNYNCPGDIKNHLIDVENSSVIIISRDLVPEIKIIKKLENKFDNQQVSTLIRLKFSKYSLDNFPLAMIITKCHNNLLLIQQTMKIILKIIDTDKPKVLKKDSKEDSKEVFRLWEEKVPPSLVLLPIFNLDFYINYSGMGVPTIAIKYFLYFINFFRSENIPTSFLKKWISSFYKENIDYFEVVKDQIFAILEVGSILTIDSASDEYCRLSHHSFKQAIQNEFITLTVEERHAFFIKVFDFLIEEIQGNKDIYTLFLHLLEADVLYQFFLNRHNKILQTKNNQHFQYSMLQRIILLRYISEIYDTLRLDTQVFSLIEQIEGLIGLIRNSDSLQGRITFEEKKVDHLRNKINKPPKPPEVKRRGSLTKHVYPNTQDNDNLFFRGEMKLLGSSDYRLLTELDEFNFDHLDSSLGLSDYEFRLLLKEVEQYELSYLSLLNFNFIDEKIRYFPRISEFSSLIYNQLKNFVYIFTFGVLIYEFSSLINKEESAFKKFESLFYGSNDNFHSSDELIIFLASWRPIYLQLLLGEPLLILIPVSLFMLSYLNNNYNKLLPDINNQLRKNNQFKIPEFISTLFSFNSLILKIGLMAKLISNRNNVAISQRIASFNFLKRITLEKQGILKLKAIERLADFDRVSFSYLINRYKDFPQDFEGAIYVKLMSYSYLRHLSMTPPQSLREYFQKILCKFLVIIYWKG